MKFDFDAQGGATVSKRLMEYTQLKNEMSEYIEVAKDVSDWLLPGRGIFNVHSRPKKRVLVPPKVVNPKAKQAFETMISFLKDGICPSSRPWFEVVYKDASLKGIQPLAQWVYEATEVLNAELRIANFYSLSNTYLKETCGFGTGSMGVFPGDKNALHFQPLTFGEYSVGTNHEGRVDRLYRTVFQNFYQLYTKFGDNLPKSLLDKFHNRDSSLDYWYTVVEGVVPETFMRMPYTRFYILIGEEGSKYDGGIKGRLPKKNKYPEFLKVEGVNEFPYPTTRFDVLGVDPYGVSPGMDAVPVIKRLQEIVKSNLIAYHKSIRPPINVPVSMKNNVHTYPDGINYYINPEEIIRQAYDTRFDHVSAETSEGKLEQTLKEIFYNDVFLTTARDPNASPLKARQVEEMSSDKYARLGPVLERLFFEGFQPILQRSFNILDRAGKLPDLPEQFAELDMSTEMNLTSILAQAVKARAVMPMREYLQDIGAMAQFKPDVMDVPNIDEFAYELATIRNIQPKMVNSPDIVGGVRAQRAEAAAAQQAKEEQAAIAVQSSTMDAEQAGATRDLSEAGVNLAENFQRGSDLL